MQNLKGDIFYSHRIILYRKLNVGVSFALLTCRLRVVLFYCLISNHWEAEKNFTGIQCYKYFSCNLY